MLIKLTNINFRRKIKNLNSAFNNWLNFKYAFDNEFRREKRYSKEKNERPKSAQVCGFGTKKTVYACCGNFQAENHTSSLKHQFLQKKMTSLIISYQLVRASGNFYHLNTYIMCRSGKGESSGDNLFDWFWGTRSCHI